MSGYEKSEDYGGREPGPYHWLKVVLLGWYAIILIPGGFGRLIWSDRPLTEWLGWCMVAAGTAIFIFSPIRNLIAGFAGVLSFMQLVVRLIPFSWFGRKRQPNEGPDEDGDNGDVNGA